ncbi:MAG TPA: GNAT family N-acetyltransferase [Steroidobacteraceae bacterium]|nr:GNAT family N-acetyltransferase [Steroidobacteraceae bacterium]
MQVQLNDARRVTIRRIQPSDLNALRAFFAALSCATRRLRFHSPINELPEQLLREFTTTNPRAHVAFVAEFHDGAVDQPATLVAEARYVRSAHSDSAEFALVVADNWRRIGLGTVLTRILAQRARFSGVRRLWGDVLEDNKAMRGLAHSLGARLSRAIGYGQIVRLSLEV